jgi:hypothetical protein
MSCMLALGARGGATMCGSQVLGGKKVTPVLASVAAAAPGAVACMSMLWCVAVKCCGLRAFMAVRISAAVMTRATGMDMVLTGGALIDVFFYIV